MNLDKGQLLRGIYGAYMVEPKDQDLSTYYLEARLSFKHTADIHILIPETVKKRCYHLYFTDHEIETHNSTLPRPSIHPLDTAVRIQNCG